ncbi:hypothetical protein [Kitasatospora aureofaciens]|uniref:hypothetical protein n=1 Tax=Kitasatospora aureofaciens TaxID=1894 RepID=UPI0036F49176
MRIGSRTWPGRTPGRAVLGVAGPEALRDFVVDHLTTHPAVAQTRPNLIFERIPGRRYLAPQR